MPGHMKRSHKRKSRRHAEPVNAEVLEIAWDAGLS